VNNQEELTRLLTHVTFACHAIIDQAKDDLDSLLDCEDKEDLRNRFNSMSSEIETHHCMFGENGRAIEESIEQYFDEGKSD